MRHQRCAAPGRSRHPVPARGRGRPGPELARSTHSHPVGRFAGFRRLISSGIRTPAASGCTPRRRRVRRDRRRSGSSSGCSPSHRIRVRHREVRSFGEIGAAKRVRATDRVGGAECAWEMPATLTPVRCFCSPGRRSGWRGEPLGVGNRHRTGGCLTEAEALPDRVIRLDASPRRHAGAGRRSCRCFAGPGCLPAKSGTCTVRRWSCGRTGESSCRRLRRPESRDPGHSGLHGLPKRPSTVDPVPAWQVFGPGEYRCWPSASGRTSAPSRRQPDPGGRPAGQGPGGPAAAGPIAETNGKLPDNVLAPVWSAAYGLYRHRCLPRAFLDRSRRDEWHEQ